MSDDRKTSQGDVLHVEVSQDRIGATIVLEGEFDMTGTERFWACVSVALAEAPRAVAVDASRLAFVDSSGLLALMRARDAAVEAGVAFCVGDPSPALRRVVEVTGTMDLLLGE
jgi:anti-anti-sigma factor